MTLGGKSVFVGSLHSENTVGVTVTTLRHCVSRTIYIYRDLSLAHCPSTPQGKNTLLFLSLSLTFSGVLEEAKGTM